MTDQTLLSRYQQRGDHDAFAALVTRYRGLVVATCTRYLRNRADVEDACQQVFIALMLNADRVHSNLGGWLHQCAVNKSVSIVRSDTARRRRERARAVEERQQDRGVEQAELRDLIDQCLSQLEAPDREVVVQTLLVGDSQRTIARSMGVSQQAVAKRKSKALGLLRVALSRRGVGLSVAALAAMLKGRVAEALPAKLGALLQAAGSSGAPAAAHAVSGGGLSASGKVGLGTAVVAAGLVATTPLIHHHTDAPEPGDAEPPAAVAVEQPRSTRAALVDEAELRRRTIGYDPQYNPLRLPVAATPLQAREPAQVVVGMVTGTRPQPFAPQNPYHALVSRGAIATPVYDLPPVLSHRNNMHAPAPHAPTPRDDPFATTATPSLVSRKVLAAGSAVIARQDPINDAAFSREAGLQSNPLIATMLSASVAEDAEGLAETRDPLRHHGIGQAERARNTLLVQVRAHRLGQVLGHIAIDTEPYPSDYDDAPAHLGDAPGGLAWLESLWIAAGTIAGEQHELTAITLFEGHVWGGVPGFESDAGFHDGAHGGPSDTGPDGDGTPGLATPIIAYAVPEPGSIVLLLSAAGLLATRRRRPAG